MKDTKIFVDIDDELTFVAEKIIHAQTNRVILVIPEKSEILSSLVELKMLGRVIHKNDKNIVIVTTDKSGKNIAERAGFIVEEKIGNVTENTWINIINLRKRISDSEKLSKKQSLSAEIYEAIDNTKDSEEIEQKEDNEEVNNRGFEMVNDEETAPKEEKDNTKKVILENFEFLVGGDIATNTKNYDKEDKREDVDENIKRTVSKEKNSHKNVDLSSILNKIPKRKKTLKRNKFIIVLTIFIILIIFIIYYLFFTVSNITVTTKGSLIKNSAIITINPNITQVNTSNMQIPAKIISINESGSNSAKTTGTKTVSNGSYASGSVTIGNYTSNPIVLPSGTILTDSNGYTCQTDAPVTIPKAPSPFSAGTTNANVTATNTNTPAPANDMFTVKGYSQSQAIANNSNAFSTGNYTTTTQQVVSSQDQSTLSHLLTSSLFAKGKSALNSESNNNATIIPQSIKYVVVNTSFDNQIGTPAQVLNLSEQIKVEGESYSKKEIQLLLTKKLESSSNSIKNLKFNINTVSVNSSSNIGISVSFSANLFKNLNKQNIINAIKGQSFAFAKKHISSVKNVSNVKITENPSIFGIFGYLPSNTKMIHINIKN